MSKTKFKINPNYLAVFTGDYINRGESSLEVLWLLLQLKFENWHSVVLTRGNHEYVVQNLGFEVKSLNLFEDVNERKEEGLHLNTFEKGEAAVYKQFDRCWFGFFRSQEEQLAERASGGAECFLE